MTEDRRRKRAIRARVAQTGEKYTEAMRAVGSGGGGSGERARLASASADDLLGWFTDQAYNAILLAEDEARMLDQPAISPAHLLLAVARFGNVQRLLASEGVTASTFTPHWWGWAGSERASCSARCDGCRPLRWCCAGRSPRPTSAASAGRARSTCSWDSRARRWYGLLREVGVADATALVDAAYPVHRPPVDAATAARRAGALAVHARHPPSPGPNPPVFERFTAEARRAVAGAVEQARSLESPDVVPAHLLLGLLCADEGVIAGLRVRHGPQLPRRSPEPPRSWRIVRRGRPGYSAHRPGDSSPRTCCASPIGSAIVRSVPATSSLPCSEARTRTPPKASPPGLIPAVTAEVSRRRLATNTSDDQLRSHGRARPGSPCAGRSGDDRGGGGECRRPLTGARPLITAQSRPFRKGRVDDTCARLADHLANPRRSRLAEAPLFGVQPHRAGLGRPTGPGASRTRR